MAHAKGGTTGKATGAGRFVWEVRRITDGYVYGTVTADTERGALSRGAREFNDERTYLAVEIMGTANGSITIADPDAGRLHDDTRDGGLVGPHPFTVHGVPVRIIDVWHSRRTGQTYAIVEYLQDDTAQGIARGSTLQLARDDVKGL